MAIADLVRCTSLFDGVPRYFCGGAWPEFQMFRLMRQVPSFCFS